MRRMGLIEIHEQPWFPAALRDQVTDALQAGMRLLKAYVPVAPFLEKLLAESECRSIIDVCSGGGGPWLVLSNVLKCGSGGRLIRLTDKCPNLGAFETLQAASGGRITFCREPVDATHVPCGLRGVRTIFSSFHHFQPGEAVAVLQDAVDARESIGVFEITRRDPATIAAMLPWAFLAFFYTPFIRPFRWSRLFWTYVLPVIPLVLLFDGVVSCLRTYRPAELRDLLGHLTRAEYHWRMGEHSSAGNEMPVTYLIGWPKQPAEPTGTTSRAQVFPTAN